jgi:hypothetical protein
VNEREALDGRNRDLRHRDHRRKRTRSRRRNLAVPGAALSLGNVPVPRTPSTGPLRGQAASPPVPGTVKEV